MNAMEMTTSGVILGAKGQSPESRMLGNGHVRFGEGGEETQCGCAPCPYSTIDQHRLEEARAMLAVVAAGLAMRHPQSRENRQDRGNPGTAMGVVLHITQQIYQPG